MSKYYVDFDGLHNKGNKEKAEIQKIDESMNEMLKAKENLKEHWKGTAANSFYKKIDSYVEELTKTKEVLVGCSDLTDSFHKNYKTTYDKVKKDFSDLHERMVREWKK